MVDGCTKHGTAALLFKDLPLLQSQILLTAALSKSPTQVVMITDTCPCNYPSNWVGPPRMHVPMWGKGAWHDISCQ